MRSYSRLAVSILPQELVNSVGQPDARRSRGLAKTDEDGVVFIDPAPSKVVFCVVWPPDTRASFLGLSGPTGELAEPEAVVGPLVASRDREPALETVVVEKRGHRRRK